MSSDMLRQWTRRAKRSGEQTLEFGNAWAMWWAVRAERRSFFSLSKKSLLHIMLGSFTQICLLMVAFCLSSIPGTQNVIFVIGDNLGSSKVKYCNPNTSGKLCLPSPRQDRRCRRRKLPLFLVCSHQCHPTINAVRLQDLWIIIHCWFSGAFS